MRIFVITAVLVACLIRPAFAVKMDRYQSQGEVVTVAGQVQPEVMKVFLKQGYATKLDLDEPIEMAINGNRALLSMVESEDKRSLVIYPRASRGVTNLLVDTQSKRLNYEIVVGEEENLDYRIVLAKPAHQQPEGTDHISMGHLIRLATNYSTLKQLGIVEDDMFRHRDIFETFIAGDVTLRFKRVLNYRSPHYLFFDIELTNHSDHAIKLGRDNALVLIDDKEFSPKFTVFYSSSLAPEESTDGWIVLEHTQLSMENVFNFILEIDHEQQKFN